MTPEQQLAPTQGRVWIAMFSFPNMAALVDISQSSDVLLERTLRIFQKKKEKQIQERAATSITSHKLLTRLGEATQTIHRVRVRDGA